jgi:hypothetical protein
MSHRTKPIEGPSRRDQPPQGRCAATGKICWGTRAAARDEVRRLRAQAVPRAAHLGTYRHVDECGYWHVGHRPGSRR